MGTPNKHFIYSLNVDSGATNAGLAGGCGRYCELQRYLFRFRSAGGPRRVALVNGIVYVPYSGYFGDCGNYHGWVVGVEIQQSFRWRRCLGDNSNRGGIWGHSGVASDGTNMFVITGNTSGTGGN